MGLAEHSKLRMFVKFPAVVCNELSRVGVEETLTSVLRKNGNGGSSPLVRRLPFAQARRLGTRALRPLCVRMLRVKNAGDIRCALAEVRVGSKNLQA